MKKTLLCAISALVLVASCKRDETNLNPDPREVRYNISLSDGKIIEQPMMSISEAGPSLPAGKISDYFQTLEYYLYDSKGQRIAQQDFKADSSATGFSIPVASLKPGKYTAVFLGRKEKDTGTSSAIYNGDDQSAPYLAHSIQREVTDLFYTSQDFEVTNTDTPVDIVLRRPGGKIKLIVEDEWPPLVERLELMIRGYTTYYPKSDKRDEEKEVIVPISRTSILTNEIVDGINVPRQTYVECSYENFILTNSSDITMVNATVRAFDKEGKIIATKPMRDIKIERNKLTTLKVRLFDAL